MKEILDVSDKETEYNFRFKKPIVVVLCLLICFSLYMRYYHIPGGLFCSIIGVAVLCSYVLFSFAFLKGKDPLNNLFFAFTIILIGYLILGYFFKNGPINGLGLTLFAGFNLISFLIQWIAFSINKRRHKKRIAAIMKE